MKFTSRAPIIFFVQEEEDEKDYLPGARGRVVDSPCEFLPQKTETLRPGVYVSFTPTPGRLCLLEMEIHIPGPSNRF
jgi:hypothetical protein